MMLINGEDRAQISAQDRGLHYGDGVFETLAVSAGVPLLWQQHMQRLQAGCTRLAIPLPEIALLESEAQQVCAGTMQGVLKIIVTRGAGARGYRVTPPVHTTRVLSLHPWPTWPETFARHGVRLRVCNTRLGINPALAGIKHLNRLEQVLAHNEWSDADIPEGLMLDASGHVISGTMSNVFMVRDGIVCTPDLTRCGVAGIVRGLIIELAAEWSLKCEIADFTLEKIQRADEIFICNSVMGVWPVREIDGLHYTHGPLTRRIASRVTELMKPCH